MCCACSVDRVPKCCYNSFKLKEKQIPVQSCKMILKATGFPLQPLLLALQRPQLNLQLANFPKIFSILVFSKKKKKIRGNNR